MCIAIKVIIHKSRGEVSLVEQDKIKWVSSVYWKFSFLLFHLYSIQFFSADTKKNDPNRSDWAVSSTANQPKTSPNLEFCFKKMSYVPLDLYIMTWLQLPLHTYTCWICIRNLIQLRRKCTFGSNSFWICIKQIILLCSLISFET